MIIKDIGWRRKIQGKDNKQLIQMKNKEILQEMTRLILQLKTATIIEDKGC